MGEDNVADFKAALKGGETHRLAVEASASKLLHADLETLAQAIQSLLSPSDAAVLTTDFADFVLRSVREGIGETRDGMIDDDIAHLAPWGFELSQIQIPVLLMHGERDLFVHVSHSKWLASKIPNVETRFLPEDGHLTVSLRRIPEVHAWLLGKV
jgi:pimeloyl-ACP methyl ester carboxylesterase